MVQRLGIRELAERAKREGAYDLAQGVIDADLPQVLVDAMREIPVKEISRYENMGGAQKYREALVYYLESRGWTVSAENVMPVAGAMAGITSALLTGLKPGAKVLLPEPFFVYHKLLLETLGYKGVFLHTEIGEEIEWEEVVDKMDDVDAVVITTPANPTGQTASVETLTKLSEAAKEKDCLLILDEM